MSKSDQNTSTLGVSHSSSVPDQLDHTNATRDVDARAGVQARVAGVQVYDPFTSEPYDDEEGVAPDATEEA